VPNILESLISHEEGISCEIYKMLLLRSTLCEDNQRKLFVP